MPSRRPSYEILRDLIKRVSAKTFAHQMGVHRSLVDRWSTDPEQAEELYGGHTGWRNPIDRTQDILRCAVTEGHHALAVEILDTLARQFGGAYVTGKEIDAIKRVAELDLTPCQVSELDIAALKRVAENDKDNGHGIARCTNCGYKYVPQDLWRPLSQFCDNCYALIQDALGKEYVLMPRHRS